MTGLDRLTDEDVRILHLESGPIRGHTCKVVILSPRPARGALPLEGLRGHVADRLPRFPRLRRRIAQTPLGLANPAWIEDAGFDVARHVVPYPAPAPLGEPALRGAVADLMARRLDRDRPLWRVDVVDRLEDGGAALVVRIHHSLADGMTAGRILSGVILDSEKPPERAAPAGSQPPPGRAP